MRLRIARKVYKRVVALLEPYPAMVAAVAVREILAPVYRLATWLEAQRIEQRAHGRRLRGGG